MKPTLINVPIDRLFPDPQQPRQFFSRDEIARLAASISARGVLQPLRVRLDHLREHYHIITGECRWRAAKFAGLVDVPCIVVEGNLSEIDILSDQLVENAVRHSLKATEQARAISKLKTLLGCTSQTLAAQLGFSNAAITRAEALLSLPEQIQNLIDEGLVPESSGYDLSRISGDAPTQLALAREIAEGKKNRDEITREVQSRLGGKRKMTPKGGRVSCKLASGLAITVTAGQALTWETLFSGLDKFRREAKRLQDDGGDVAALARLRRIS